MQKLLDLLNTIFSYSQWSLYLQTKLVLIVFMKSLFHNK